MPLYLKPHRAEQEVTQALLARRVGVAVGTIRRWESGARTPGADDIEALAKALGLHPGDLFMPPASLLAAIRERQAAQIAKEMTDEVAAVWLEVGRTLARVTPGAARLTRSAPRASVAARKRSG
jgi:transcriptional regulator with XRE-family HTH domain